MNYITKNDDKHNKDSRLQNLKKHKVLRSA